MKDSGPVTPEFADVLAEQVGKNDPSLKDFRNQVVGFRGEVLPNSAEDLVVREGKS